MRRQIKEGYEIIEELGAGGMATVYKAKQASLARFVAIKELKKEFHPDQQQVERFKREAETSASFQHENIVHIYDFWTEPHYCIVMEYVDGTDLAELIEERGPLPVDVGIMIALQACSALGYAHSAGLIHRDIKPGNIMVKQNGEVKLMDFGIAQTRQLLPLTLPGTFIGTPAYMSPDQILGQPLDARSDIFSFGIVLYEMFTGVKPFLDEANDSVSGKILEGRFPAPRKINKNIPRGLQRVIKKCLRKKPQRRYASMKELANALGKKIRGKTDKEGSLKRISNYLLERGVFTSLEKTEAPAAPKTPSNSFYSTVIVAAAITLGLLTAGVAYYFWVKAQETIPSRPGAEIEKRIQSSVTTSPSATPPVQLQGGGSGTAGAAAPQALPAATIGQKRNR